MKEDDKISKDILDIILNSEDPLFTSEINEKTGKPRYLIFNRLQQLKKEKKIKGKQLKKRGSWMWWRISEDTQINKGIEDEIKELQNQLQKIKSTIKFTGKKLKREQIDESREKERKYNEKIEFLNNIISIHEEHVYRDHIHTFLEVINKIMDEYCDNNEREKYKQQMINNDIPIEFISSIIGD